MWVSYGFLDRTLGGFKRGSPQNLFQGQGLINPRGYSIKLWVVTTWWLSSNKPHKVAPYGTMEKAGLGWPWCHLSGSIPLFSSKAIRVFILCPSIPKCKVSLSLRNMAVTTTRKWDFCITLVESYRWRKTNPNPSLSASRIDRLACILWVFRRWGCKLTVYMGQTD